LYLLNEKASLGIFDWLSKYAVYLLIALAICSCKSYQANILFEVEEEAMEELSSVLVEVHEHYVVSPDDKLQVEVYTNRGEELLDPINALQDDRNDYQSTPPIYQVQPDGLIELPIIGQVELAGLTISEVNKLLEQRYGEFYKDPYVLTRFMNKRVIVLGATGGKVVPLDNEGMNLLEVLALAGGINNDAKGHNVRLIRGDLSNPQVQVIDLTTIEGMTRANLQVQPNDIVYVEPVRRPFTEGLKDVVPILSLLTSVLALVVAFNR